jgi:hypothetical protein
VTISERIEAGRRERRVLTRVSRAAWRLEQAERERTWALVSARAEGISIRRQPPGRPRRARNSPAPASGSAAPPQPGTQAPGSGPRTRKPGSAGTSPWKNTEDSGRGTTPEFRVIRLHTRYRRDLTEERTREKQRAEKLLESAAVKLSSVVTDLHGVTGRDIMNHLIAGERSPKVLAQLARGRARRKVSELENALEGAGVLHPGARRAAGHDARPHRPAQRRHRGDHRRDRAAAGPV